MWSPCVPIAAVTAPGNALTEAKKEAAAAYDEVWHPGENDMDAERGKAEGEWMDNERAAPAPVIVSCHSSSGSSKLLPAVLVACV